MLWDDKQEGSINSRLVDRDDRFGQSYGRFKVQRKIKRNVWCRFYLQDWFHSLINTKWYRIVWLVVAVYFLAFTFFACLYSMADDTCVADIVPPDDPPHGHNFSKGARRFLRAFFFSVETMMTIGSEHSIGPT
jgi:hypothetical protein